MRLHNSGNKKYLVKNVSQLNFGSKKAWVQTHSVLICLYISWPVLSWFNLSLPDVSKKWLQGWYRAEHYVQTPKFWSWRFSWTSVRAKFAPNYVTSVDFCWDCMTIIYFRHIFGVLPKEKLFSIYFRGRYTTASRREPSPQLFNNTVFVNLNDKLGETGVLVNCPGGGGHRRGRCLPQRQLKTVESSVLLNFLFTHFKGCR